MTLELTKGPHKGRYLRLYRNKRDGKEIVIVRRERDLLKIYYLSSGTHAWYDDEDFHRIFEVS